MRNNWRGSTRQAAGNASGRDSNRRSKLSKKSNRARFSGAKKGWQPARGLRYNSRFGAHGFMLFSVGFLPDFKVKIL